MPSDDSLFTNSLKRRFRKVIAESAERSAASEENTGEEIKAFGPAHEGSNASNTGEQTAHAGEPAGEVATTDASETAGEEQPVFNEVGHSLAELFSRKAVSDPLVRALLERHAAVDARELTDELDRFAREIGARTDELKEVRS